MTPYDPQSKELKELEEMEEQQIEQELGRCPGPVDLWSSAIDRRGLFKVGMGGLLSLLLAQWLDPRMAYAQGPAPKAKACILLWMNGGPSQLDTWDPKPGTDTGGSFKAIPTRVKEVSICEHLPMLADQADHLAIIRSMTSREGNHQRAQYLMHTGYAPNPTVTHPSLGAWVSEELGSPQAELPDFVSISGPSFGAGFLGVQYGPLVVQNPNQLPQNVAFAPNVTPGRFEMRRSALDMLESDFAAQTRDNKVKGREAVYGRAIRMMRSPKLKAFDISEEPDAVKAAYGDSNFGRGCLMARRLVEAGVKFVEVVLDGWDTHQDNFNRTTKLMGALDPAMSTLIKELADRHLLDSTLILWMGEFGRTPKINPNEGRDHYPQAWSAALAGGGVRGGQAYGQTDAEGMKVVDKPVVVPDLFATIATLLGLDPSKSFMTPVGRPIAITEKGKPIRELIG
ncbi:MAG TPA: DUF1501 domain-containing protein [Chthonomonadaceae bacterium]|nr:DUF1501 domain-containing protein [Chthonomonadaceae bacterium]